MKSRKKKIYFGKIIEILPLILFSITIIGSLFFLIITSLKLKNEYIVNKTGLPVNITLANFSEVISKAYFLRWLLNSMIITIFSLVVGGFIAILLSYGFSSYKFRFRNNAFAIVSSLMVVPPIVLIIPLYELLSELQMVNTYYGTISVYISWIIPFWTFFLAKFFGSISKSIIESAKIDGCSDIKLLFRIILPLSKAPIMTLATVSTLWVWNDLLISLIFLQKDLYRTLMVGLTVFKGIYSTNVPATFAGLIIATIPMLIFYIFGQRFFRKGVLSGAVKE